MAEARLQIRMIRGGRVLRDFEDIRDRALDMTPWAQAAKGHIRRSILEEFMGRHWKLPTGGTRAWAARKDDKPHPLLRQTGAMLQAWLGQGPFSVERVTKGSVTVGVDASGKGKNSMARARVHRGGLGRTVSTITSMRGIVPRPHATRNPELTARMNASARAFLTTGRP